VILSVSPLGRGQTIAIWTIGFAVVQFAAFVFPGEMLAQVPRDILRDAQQMRFRIEAGKVELENALIQEIEIRGQAGMGLVGNQPLAANSKPQLLKKMRGLIQNELSIVNSICNLEQKQKQSLVDLAEADWKAKTNTSIIKRTQYQNYGSIDLDSLAERVVRTWLESVATPEQLRKYDDELADRMNWRKKALISKMLDILSEKLTLSGVQMAQIEEVLNEKWKDRWFRSLEATFDSTSFLPEIKPSWIAPLLTQSQSAAFVTRDQQIFFGNTQDSADSPSLALEQRFQVGSALSADEMEVAPMPKGTSGVDPTLKKAKAGEKEGTPDAKNP